MSPGERPENPDGASATRRDRAFRIGVDIGGTFTDLVAAGTGEDGPWMRSLKVLSTPGDPSRAVLEGIRRIRELAPPTVPPDVVVHGSTVATNAVLERTGARTAFVATEGFRDLLAIARQQRPHLYDLFADRPAPLVPGRLCFGVHERVDREGEVLSVPSGEEIDALGRRLREGDVESVAVCFLFSFLHPEHEARVAEALRQQGLRVSCSHEVLPEFREYERASTTVVDAYVSPVLDRYLERLDRGLEAGRLRVMQSAGGSAGVEAARRQGVRSLLSGPAGGVVGALHVARTAGYERALTLDMGGTSTDVSLAEGEPRITTEAEVGGIPVGIPVIDLHTVGSGGGSVARVDPGGALRVGPESAGSDPGPVCYGRGGERPTVTDAHLVLGRIAPDRFLGGRMTLEPGPAREALERLGREAELPDPGGIGAARAAAAGVVRVAGARMERALRVISVERGHDPADFVLVSFGGAGGLHACALARALGVRRVLLPPGASTLSAFGMLAADVRKDHGRTVMLAGDTDRAELEDRFRPLERRVREELREEGFGPGEEVLDRSVEMRYRGQSYELRIPYGPDFRARFHRRHREVYGHDDPGAPLEIVTLRVRGTGRVDPPDRPEASPGPPDPSDALLDRRPVTVGLEGTPAVRECPFYAGERLRPGHRLEGPAVVAREDTTLFLGAADRAGVDGRFNLVVEVGG